jgi:hypothetical protein
LEGGEALGGGGEAADVVGAPDLEEEALLTEVEEERWAALSGRGRERVRLPGEPALEERREAVEGLAVRGVHVS